MIDAQAIARIILDGFDRHYRLFRAMSTNAKGRWERRDWVAIREAGRTRIDMYDQRVREGVEALERSLDGAVLEEAMWPTIKRAYIGMLHEHAQPECAETFFNSVARRVLGQRYYRNDYIFSRPAISTEHLDGAEPTYRCYYPASSDLRDTFREALAAFEIDRPFAALDRDIERMGQMMTEHLPDGWKRRPNCQVHVLRSLFFRNKGAYAVGRIVNGSRTTPFIIALLMDEHGAVYVDTILLARAHMERLFTVGRSYFFVDMEVPAAYIDFLASVVPRKAKAELYTMVGLQKQGKTISFRDLEHHLRHSTDTFVLAPGTKGMVMVVFTLPSFPYVFKIIRDWFAPPKDTDRKTVEDRYKYVKTHDRVGRMSDTLEYAHVAFPIRRLDKQLIEELERFAPSIVERDGEHMVLTHLYLERRLVPLDVYLRDASIENQRAAINDYGNALKDLAGANIFAGDLLLKNFGLTPYGRVVFYDYDELCELTECRFRTLPRARDDDDEISADPWFSVEPGDIFPEQFPTFLFPPGPQRELFIELHGDLATAAFWRAQQERIVAGVQEDLFAYPQSIRFVNTADADASSGSSSGSGLGLGSGSGSDADTAGAAPASRTAAVQSTPPALD
jgi:isocitrate dehydrogenase kinase/phosphatase